MNATERAKARERGKAKRERAKAIARQEQLERDESICQTLLHLALPLDEAELAEPPRQRRFKTITGHYMGNMEEIREALFLNPLKPLAGPQWEGPPGDWIRYYITRLDDELEEELWEWAKVDFPPDVLEDKPKPAQGYRLAAPFIPPLDDLEEEEVEEQVEEQVLAADSSKGATLNHGCDSKSRSIEALSGVSSDSKSIGGSDSKDIGGGDSKSKDIESLSGASKASCGKRKAETATMSTAKAARIATNNSSDDYPVTEQEDGDDAKEEIEDVVVEHGKQEVVVLEQKEAEDLGAGEAVSPVHLIDSLALREITARLIPFLLHTNKASGSTDKAQKKAHATVHENGYVTLFPQDPLLQSLRDAWKATGLQNVHDKLSPYMKSKASKWNSRGRKYRCNYTPKMIRPKGLKGKFICVPLVLTGKCCQGCQNSHGPFNKSHYRRVARVGNLNVPDL